MVELSAQGGVLVLNVKGLDQVWAFKRSLQVPFAAIESVRADAASAKSPQGTRNPGTYIPGIIVAGTFDEGVKRVFWDVHNPDKAIVIRLKSGQYNLLTLLDDNYDELIVEVEDPDKAVNLIRENISSAGAFIP